MALSLDGTTGISASGNIVGNNISVVGSLSVGSFNPATISVSGNVNGGNILTGGLISATGNISGGNLNVTGNIVDTGALSIISGSNGNIALVPNGTGIVTASSALSVSGNVTGGNILTAGTISATGNITGQNINSANADLAEMYVADSAYQPGTVVEFGGDYEITATTQNHSTRVAGIISTAPSYLMNTNQAGTNVLPVALIGRVPCLVLGPITKGDCLVSSDVEGVAQALDPSKYRPACIIGKALQDYTSTQVGTIEVVVGRT